MKSNNGKFVIHIEISWVLSFPLLYSFLIFHISVLSILLLEFFSTVSIFLLFTSFPLFPIYPYFLLAIISLIFLFSASCMIKFFEFLLH